jgi:predicted dehydrogenase
MVDFNRRFWPAYGRVRDFVRHGTLGAPVHVEFGIHLDVLRWSVVTRHRFDLNEGGLLHDLGCHAIDLALQIVGQEPDHVTAVTSSRRWTDDQLRLRLDFPDGSSATCDLRYGDRTREWLVVRGPAKTACLAEPNMALHVAPSGAPRGPLTRWPLDALALGYRAVRRSQSMGRASIRAALCAFVQSLRTNAPFAPNFADGVHNARWVATAARSAATAGTPQRP